MKKLIKAKKQITVCFGILLTVSWILYAIFGENERKIAELIFTPVFTVIVYAIMRLQHRWWCSNRHESYVTKVCVFDLVFGALCFLLCIPTMILNFPASPCFIGITAAMILSAINAAERYLDKK